MLYKTINHCFQAFTYEDFIQYGLQCRDVEEFQGSPIEFDFFGFRAERDTNLGEECYFLFHGTGYYTFYTHQILIVANSNKTSKYKIALVDREVFLLTHERYE